MILKIRETRLQGTSISRGIAIGKPFFISQTEDILEESFIIPDQVAEEIVRYRAAVAQGKEEVRRLQMQLEKEQILEGAAILDAQIQIMQDPLMTDHIEKQILQTLKNAEHVVQTTVKEYQIKFNSIQDPIFRERFKDIQDVARRITAYLTARKRLSLKDIPANSIVFAKELSPSMVAEANNTRIKGFVSQVGASNSHVAIVARARGVPYVSNINFNEIESFHHCIVIIDGRTGEVIIDPTSETLEKYYNLQEKLDDQITHLKKVSALASETYDGYRVQLCG
jgi:phosphoenolpyruvate-protein phosphotransferase (PTS system enzyme I)